MTVAVSKHGHWEMATMTSPLDSGWTCNCYTVWWKWCSLGFKLVLKRPRTFYLALLGCLFGESQAPGMQCAYPEIVVLESLHLGSPADSASWAPGQQPVLTASQERDPCWMSSTGKLPNDCSPSWHLTAILWENPSMENSMDLLSNSQPIKLWAKLNGKF